MHSIFSVKSVSLGSTAATFENMSRSSIIMDGFPHELCNTLQKVSSNVFKRHRAHLSVFEV